MTGKREERLTQLARALATLDDIALLDAWKEAVAIRQAAKPTGRNGDEAGLRAAVCEDVAAKRFGADRHVALYRIRHGVVPGPDRHVTADSSTSTKPTKSDAPRSEV